MEVVLRTIHGSHLYGLAHKDSDLDVYTVVNNRHLRRRAHQKIEGVNDSFIIDLTYFLHLVEEGVPQAAEALFSPIADIDKISSFRHRYKMNTAKAANTYRRTIKNFYAAGDFKRRRHALRLYLNLLDILEYGRFNSRLTPAQIVWVNDNANSADWIMEI